MVRAGGLSAFFRQLVRRLRRGLGSRPAARPPRLASLSLEGSSDRIVDPHDGGQVDPASANDLIGTGGSGGLVNGVNGNVVL